MRNRLLAVGVLLLGIAAIGKVGLSWVQQIESSKQQKRQEESQKLEQVQRHQEQMHREAIVKACNTEAIQAAAQFSGGDDLYKAAYLMCLRKNGLEP